MKSYCTVLLQIIVVLSLLGCQQPSDRTSNNQTIPPPCLVHSVYFWLNNDISPKDRHRFFEHLNKLSKIPTVQNFLIGPPANTDKRDIIDNSYDLGIITTFASMADHDAYQVSDIHQALLKMAKPLIAKVNVYDISYK
jgi:hypothetical protein